MTLPRGVVPEPAGPGQESVWDYPRPPRVEPTSEHVLVVLGGRVVVDTRAALRVLETSHPPTYYLPFADADAEALRPAAGQSLLRVEGPGEPTSTSSVAARASRSWRPRPPGPTPTRRRATASLAGYLALYPGRMSSVTVDGEAVRPQAGGFYGGWVTDRVVGPFKGGPGSTGW
ncbi:hypothetical protein GCM10025868_11200 [Angustibacter aerolatus]|uniref:DUF427 domain-containing protein n=1 Tax=Angustibacter aerolatus TaxID=1162965 RepID=A0ABQ6JGA1_9ACTN|nr:DUF427 domain-containing protein [Angustibacter aerolatus]GMA85870.1 hypothetical protein GCM10025868_11200 [Angustibacter aerolatus]